MILMQRRIIVRNKTLVLIPVGGLCNRLRVIACAYALCRDTGQNLIVYWNINESLGCDSNCIFSNSEKFKIVNVYENRLARWVSRMYFKMQKESKKVTFYEDCKAYEKVKRESHHDGREYTLTSKTIIYTCDVFYHMDFSYITWNSQLKDEAYRIAGSNAEYIGVHIRRTDHAEAIEYSTDEKFDRIIGKLVQQKKKIYLATDDVSLCRKIVNKYGSDRFIYNHDNDRRRDDKRGMMNACIDVINLSGATMIYGSYQSSFSELAAKVGDIPLVIVQ